MIRTKQTKRWLAGLVGVMLGLSVLPALADYVELYTVQRGDSLKKIAQELHMDVNELIELNGLANPDLLQIGQNLVVQPGRGYISGDGLIGGTYTVKKGDTLSRIARRYGTTVNTLAERNGLDNVNQIHEGQLLVIKEDAGVSTGGTTTTSNTYLANNRYTVQKGDSLSRIARRFYVTVEQLMELNALIDRDFLTVGQQLIIYYE